MLCPVYGHELIPLSCPPSQGVSFRSFKGLIILSPYSSRTKLQNVTENGASKLLLSLTAALTSRAGLSGICL